jgi:hypothetical protein
MVRCLDCGRMGETTSSHHNYCPPSCRSWDSLPNGQGFLLIQDCAQPRTSVHLVQNWFKVQ